tara:strand:- start:2151 stop:2516 length:366 start_codon:yes stop_codon:yes gene_type:complete
MLNIEHESKTFDEKSIEVMAALEVRFPGENVGIAWRPTANDESVIVVCGAVDSFKEAIGEVDPEFVNEPVRQYCRDLSETDFVDEDVSGIIKVKAANVEDALVTAQFLVTTGGGGEDLSNN